MFGLWRLCVLRGQQLRTRAIKKDGSAVGVHPREARYEHQQKSRKSFKNEERQGCKRANDSTPSTLVIALTPIVEELYRFFGSHCVRIRALEFLPQVIRQPAEKFELFALCRTPGFLPRQDR